MIVDYSLPVYQRVRNYIKENGLIIKVISTRSGFKGNALYDRLSGKVQMNPDELEKICVHGLGKNPEFFLTKISPDRRIDETE